jgi:hypothetical protein
MGSEGTDIEHAAKLATLQELVDEAEAVGPLQGMGRLVVGSWLAMIAHYLWAGGVTVGGLDTFLFGLLAAAGWGYVSVGGVRFLRSRLKLRQLRKDLAHLLGARSADESESVGPKLLAGEHF